MRTVPGGLSFLGVLALAAALVPLACGGEDSESDATADVSADASGDLGGPDAATVDVSGSDIAGADAAAEVFIPPLEKISKIAFKLGDIPYSFDRGAGADYVPGDSLLKVSADGKELRKIEIGFAPIDPFVVGNFDDTDSSGVTVIICYNDGVTLAQAPGCPDGFSHSSTLYKATLTENNGEGSRVVGTFEATLEDANGLSTSLTEGTFDVLHK